MAQAVLQVSFLLFSLFQVNSEIYLHRTTDALSTESYDCVFVNSSLFYCRRPTESIDLFRDNQSTECQLNDGQLHRFSELRSKNISVSTVLHRWRSTLERVEDYSRYWRDSSSSDGLICECLRPGSFGKNCEYRLPVGKTFEETLDWQLMMRKDNPWEVQAYGDIVCYQTLQCDSGMLCLDWREICDGIQNCREGRDEENCDLLEMNPCDEREEYRCMNGMCIPDEFFLDGELDCLDWSDEIQYKKSEDCSLESVSEECDDHLCPPNQWSCGDGQCISDRTLFKESLYARCQSERDQHFMCEMRLENRQWTMPNGRCYGIRNNTRCGESVVGDQSDEERCEYLLKCALTQKEQNDCSCGRGCVEEFKQVCRLSLIRYPRGAIVTPFVFFLFTSKRISTFSVHFIRLNGTVRCGNSLITVTKIIPFTYFLDASRVIDEHFCRPSRNVSWLVSTQSRRECHRANESIDRCSEWNPCLSITRIEDGWSNCINGRDEDDQTATEIEKSCSRVRRHRFHCSAEESTCLSVASLGTKSSSCQNNFDVWWFGSVRLILELNCNDRKKDECSLLRRYVDQSWESFNENEIYSIKVRIPFRFYCDSFWDLQLGKDEDLDECRRSWICLEDEFQCQTGQCYQPEWRGDDDWDCADASDEYRFLTEITRWTLGRASTHNFTNQSYSIPSTCPQSDSFLCLSAQATRQGFSCFHFSQIGDGHIDCAGAKDEIDTLNRCSQSSLMLGHNFLCPSTNSCIPYYLHCFNNHRCPNRSDDEHWCSGQYRLSSCSDRLDFTCFDGRCEKGGRCDLFFGCPYGEDEYMCDYLSSERGTLAPYREEKRLFQRAKKHFVRLSRYPSDANITVVTSHLIFEPQPPRPNFSNVSFVSPYWCNRGLGVLLRNDSIVCFCPPQYYGEKCQFHADRLSVLLHLNLSQSLELNDNDPSAVLKLVVLFLFNDQILMSEQFHLQPSLDMSIRKLIVHFPYSHSSTSLQERRNRFFNRSDILHIRPYSIRIELYRSARIDEPLSMIALWKYPIDFDHFPVYRLAKILHFSESSYQRNPCLSHPCHDNEQCQQLMNDKSRHICLCRTNYAGENCLMKDQKCLTGYCAKGSLCQPNSRGSRPLVCVQ